ncbi:MAG: oxidoreductase [Pirellulaceae bacterium]|nr:oxidoreductase [Pirellulaceae bacterium]
MSILDPAEAAPPQRRRIRELEVMVADTIFETHDTTTIVFFTGNDRLEYQAGHFLTIDPHDFPELERFTAYLEDVKGKKEPPRAYSIASAPQEKYLAITVKEERYVSGQTKFPPLLSPLLVRRLQKGRRLPITGFTGPYTLPADIESQTDTILHVCAGSGVVPNYSIIKYCLAERPKLKHIVIDANKTWGDVIYGQHLNQLAAQHPDKLTVVHSLTREPNVSSVGPNVRSGRISEALLREFVPDPSAVHVYCCGPGITKFDRDAARAKGEQPAPRFLESALAALAAIGVPPKQIHRESYG